MKYMLTFVKGFSWNRTSVLIHFNQLCVRKEMFYLTTHSTHFIYGYMASDIW